MKINKKYIAFAGMAYLVFLVVLFPAEHLYALMEDQLKAATPGLAVYGIQGSVWQGNADRVDIDDQVLQAVHWDVHPSALLLGKLKANVSFSNPTGKVDTVVARSLGGDIILEDTLASMDMQALLGLLNIPLIKLTGQLNVNMESLVLEDKQLTQAVGRVVWHDAGSKFPQNVTFGDLAAQIDTTDEGVNAILSDSGGLLQAAGKLVLAEEGAYQFKGSFGAREGQNSTLGRTLTMLGRMNRDQQVEVEYSGNLVDFGFGDSKTTE